MYFDLPIRVCVATGAQLEPEASPERPYQNFAEGWKDNTWLWIRGDQFRRVRRVMPNAS